MTAFIAILLLLLVLMALTPLARRIDVPLPIVLVIGGLALSAVPHMPEFRFDPELVFLIFVPPMLYWSCITANFRDLRRQRGAIGMLAIGAVVVTIAAVAAAVHYGPPHLGWAPSIVLGAIVSPPDAAVTIAIARRLGIPHRLVSLLEGETLFNDVSAFTAYRLAITAALTGSFTAWAIAPRLLYTAVAAVAVGAAVAWMVIWLRRRITDSVVSSTLSLMTAYAAYLPAEAIGSTGVVAVVTTGILLGRLAPRLVNAEARMQASQMWPVVLFILNGLIFLLIGRTMGALAYEVVRNHEWGLVVPCAIVSAVVIVVRVAFVFGSAASMRLRRGGAPVPMSELLFVAWTGIRGGDTLVTALAIPTTVAIAGTDGSFAPFPGRHAIQVIAVAVILVTLVIQGSTLKPLLRTCTLASDDSEEHEERLARTELARAGVARLDELATERRIPEAIVAQIRIHHHLRRHVRSGSELQPDNVGSSILASHLLDLNRHVLTAERQAVLALRESHQIGEEVVRRIQRELDLEELVMMKLADEA
jgi:Na+/H+ antiporter